LDITLTIFNITVGIVVFLSIIRKLVKRQMNETNSIIWLLVAFVTLILGMFPQVMNYLARILNIDYQPALLFLMAIVVLLLICFENSIGISKTEAKASEMAIIVSLLKEENKKLRERVEKLEEKKINNGGD
jgi:hypothetical protein